MFGRIAATVGLIAALYVLPWWATLGLGLWAAASFAHYYELLLVAFLFDLSYGAAGQPPFFVPLPVTVLALIAVILANEIRIRIIRRS